jgi:hypothetical protein
MKKSERMRHMTRAGASVEEAAAGGRMHLQVVTELLVALESDLEPEHDVG